MITYKCQKYAFHFIFNTFIFVRLYYLDMYLRKFCFKAMNKPTHMEDFIWPVEYSSSSTRNQKSADFVLIILILSLFNSYVCK